MDNVKRVGLPPLYLALIAVYPVLALASANAGEIRLPGDLLLPLSASLLLAAIAWGLSIFVTRSARSRRLCAVTLIIFAEWYGWVIRDLVGFESGINHLAAITTWAVWLLLIAILVLRLRIRGISRYANVGAAALVALPVLSLVRYSFRGAGPLASASTTAPATVAHSEGTRYPDIFLVILDKYTGGASLRRNYGWSNAAFERALRNEGFVVPAASHANYIHTFFSLASFLNWEYLDGLADYIGSDSKDFAQVYPMVENNRTWSFLRERGYRFVFIPSAFMVTAQNRNADVVMIRPKRTTSEFTAAWMRSTVFFPAQEALCAQAGVLCALPWDAFISESADVTDWKFDALGHAPQSDAPIFVFAHMLVPHEPYVYRSDCVHRPPFWPLDDRGPRADDVRAAYLEQIGCVNRKLLDLVRALKARPGPPPLILLQSDHGHGRISINYRTAVMRSPKELAAAEIEERTNVFAAYYLPGVPDGVIADSIAMINVLPTVFNLYFDTHLPMHDDRSYWSTLQRPFDFERVR